MKEFNNNFDPRARHEGHGAHRGFGPGFGPGFGGPRGGFMNPLAGFGPDSRREFAKRAPRGGVRLGLLALIEEESRNGYGLIQAFAAKTNGNWSPQSGAVYPVLNQLIDEGLVTVDEQGMYSLTEAGREVLTAQRGEIDAIFQRFANHQIPPLFDAMRKLMPALHQFAKQATPEQQADIAAKMDELRKDIYLKLGE